MIKLPRPSTNDLELRLAMRIGASDDSVRGHPVVRMRHSLLRSQQRQHRCYKKAIKSQIALWTATLSSRTETVYADALSGRQIHHFALQREVIPFSRPAEDALARRADDFHAKVV
jgi:hypothetical protein